MLTTTTFTNEPKSFTGENSKFVLNLVENVSQPPCTYIYNVVPFVSFYFHEVDISTRRGLMTRRRPNSGDTPFEMLYTISTYNNNKYNT